MALGYLATIMARVETKESAPEIIKGYGAMTVELSTSNCYNKNGFLYVEMASIPALRWLNMRNGLF